jgi:hypothetical protein
VIHHVTDSSIEQIVAADHLVAAGFGELACAVAALSAARPEMNGMLEVDYSFFGGAGERGLGADLSWLTAGAGIRMGVEVQDCQIWIYAMQGSELRQSDAAVATHGQGNRAVFGDTANGGLDIGKRFTGVTRRHVDVPTVDQRQASQRIEIGMGRLVRPK